ncbi:hypothetical protein AQZ52_10850 [Novosphingobium fuchskuhlense]|uniref:Uncharacterized protein n=1 Tax=Novosphingobium fuchskuhlense TaxID=1117702 RepID=A0A124JUE8_9SPHN|nr:hypothetical protein [Novosphingobium fuchskuhlense]KUR71162.1 hypothetical protein AQZ52_10850 [Novosphingobium fuchskuhlense]
MIASIIMALFGRWLADAEGVIKDQWRWITATPVHLLGAVLAVSVALNLWQWHICAMRAREVDALTLERNGWRKAEEVTIQSNDKLTKALHEQNAAVEGLKADADKRVLAGQAALGAAKDRSAVREDLAARIDAQRASAGTGDNCRTSPAVMAAKGQL